MWKHLPWPPGRLWTGDPDVVHGTNAFVPPTHAPSVVTVHDLWNRHLGHSNWKMQMSQLRKCVNRANCLFHAVSNAVSADLQDVFPSLDASRIFVAYHGPPDSERLSSAEDPLEPSFDAPSIVAFGALGPRKNYVRLLAAFSRLTDILPGATLTIAGPHCDRDTFSSICQAHASSSAADQILIRGWVPDSERRSLLKTATVLAYPSLYEGFGFPVLEAQHAGLPVVAANAGGIPEVAGSAALLVDPFDVDEIADGLIRAVTDSALRDSLIRAGRSNVERFSWEDQAIALTTAYKTVVEII